MRNLSHRQNSKYELEIEGFSSIPIRADCKLPTPQSRPRVGVCLYFKESLPVKRHSDLELIDETICAEISLNRTKVIFLLSYRSPSQSPAEFQAYMQNLQSTFLKASSENPSIIILAGDFNARSPLLWEHESSQTPEGRDLADFCTLNCLEQVIKEATHIPNDNTHTCIDLVLTNQPFLFVDSGVIHSPDPLLKHQIIFGKLNLNVPSPPPYKRKVWDFSLAHTLAIKSQMLNIQWEHLLANRCLDEAVKIFTDTFLFIMNSNIPNKIVTFDDRDAPWVTPPLKNLLRKDRKVFSDWKKNMIPSHYARVKQHQDKTKKAIIDAKNATWTTSAKSYATRQQDKKHSGLPTSVFQTRRKIQTFPQFLITVNISPTSKKKHLYSITTLQHNASHSTLRPFSHNLHLTQAAHSAI